MTPEVPFLVKDEFRDGIRSDAQRPDEGPRGIHAPRLHRKQRSSDPRSDIEIWSEVMGRTFAAGGVGPNDILQNSYGYGLFTGGLGAHYGASRVGASVIPTSAGNTKRQIQVLQDFGSTAICCTPSYAILLARLARDGHDFDELPVRVGFFGAEPWSESMRHQIEDSLRVRALDIYGLSEVIGPGVAYECLAQDGLHVSEDHFYPEIINPTTLELVPDGAHGELVFTTLTKTGLPLFGTAPGTHVPSHRGLPVRTDDSQNGQVSGHRRHAHHPGCQRVPIADRAGARSGQGHRAALSLVIDRAPGRLDEVELWVEVSEDVISDEVRRMESLEHKIVRELESVRGCHQGAPCGAKSIARSEGKAKRVVDRRDLGI